MAKAFDDHEKAAIRKSLMEAGLKQFAAQGIRKARIDDICRDVGIAKGSFYTFFPSKEDLFMTLANERDETHKADMRAYLRSASGDSATVVGAFFDFVMARIEADPVLNLVNDRGEITYLMRKVSPKLIKDNTQRDSDFLIEIAEIFRQRYNLAHVDAAALEGLMTLMVALGLQAEFIEASTNYRATIALMRDLFLSRLMRGPYDD